MIHILANGKSNLIIILLVLTHSALAQISYINTRWLADSLFRQGNFAEAIPIYHQCINNPESQRIDFYRLSVAYLKEDINDSAFFYLALAANKKLKYNTMEDFYADSNMQLFCKIDSSHEAIRIIKQNTNKKITCPKLQKQLLQKRISDQKYRTWSRKDENGVVMDSIELSKRWKEQVKIDKKNQKWLNKKLNKYGWLGYEKVGYEGDNAAWLIVQHADLDTIFQNKALQVLIKAVKKGDTNVNNYAYLVDRLLLNTGKKQLYGTQFRDVIKDGQLIDLEFKPIEDEINVDKRRNLMKLPPIVFYKKMALEHFKKQENQ